MSQDQPSDTVDLDGAKHRYQMVHLAVNYVVAESSEALF